MTQRRERVEYGTEDLFTDMLLETLRYDWAAIKIQTVIRAFRIRRIRGRVVIVLGKEIKGLGEMHGEDVGYAVSSLFEKKFT